MGYRFHLENAGKLAKRDEPPAFVPCTPKGVLELLKRSGTIRPPGPPPPPPSHT